MNFQKSALGFLRISIGSLFIVSGFSKIIDSIGFVNLLFQYGIGIFSYLGPILSPIEVIIGLCFMTRGYAKRAGFFAFFLTVVFTIIYIMALYFKGIEDCGCFGSWLKMTPGMSIIRNTFIIIGSFFIWQKMVSSNAISAWQNLVLLTIGALSFSISGYTVERSLEKVFSIKTTEGKKLIETNLETLKAKSKSKKSAFFVFSPACPHCWNVTENVKRLKESGVYGEVIGIITDNRKDGLDIYKEKMKPNFEIVIIEKKVISESIGMRVPKLLVVEDGTIVKIFENEEIPCPQLVGSFKHN